MFGRYYEEFTVGEIIRHDLTKTIQESDNNLFCLLTMNHHPIHLNKEFALKSQQEQILVVGTLVISLVVGMTVPDISGKAIANLSYDKVRHLHPVYVGDTIHVQTEILGKRLSKSKPDRGLVHVSTCAFNQFNVEVLSFERTILVPSKGNNND